MMTKEIEKVLERYPIYTQDGLMGDAKVICYYFYPMNDSTWIVTEGERTEGGDWEFFGLVKLQEWEWGYFRLSDIEAASRELPIPIEREIYTRPLSRTVRELATGCPEYLLAPRKEAPCEEAPQGWSAAGAGQQVLF